MQLYLYDIGTAFFEADDYGPSYKVYFTDFNQLADVTMRHVTYTADPINK